MLDFSGDDPKGLSNPSPPTKMTREHQVLEGMQTRRSSKQLSRCSAKTEASDFGTRLGNIVSGVFTPVLAKHAKSFSLIDCISAGVDRMQRNFEPMRKQVEKSQQSELTDVTAKIVIYEAFVEGRLEAPKHLARRRNDVSSLTRHATRSRSDSRSWRRRPPAPLPDPEPGQGSPRTSIPPL
jgi:hypothetical protein